MRFWDSSALVPLLLGQPRSSTARALLEQDVRKLLEMLRDSWFEIQPGDAVREQALRLLRLHPLRAADALQLAAALEWAGSPPAGSFVTFDDRLGEAAQREGFTLPDLEPRRDA